MLSRLPRLLPRWMSLVVVLFGPFAAQAAPRAELTAEDEAIVAQKWPEARANPSGLRYVVLTEGTGDQPKPRQRLTVLYRGLLIDGTEFSAGLDPKDPFVFRLGAGEVIAGWEEAFGEMRVGEKRVLIIPYSLGYGLRGNPPKIPNRATLVFEIELLKIE